MAKKKKSSIKATKKLPKLAKKLPKLSKKRFSNDRDTAYDFAVKAYRKFDKAIKSIVLFGSVAKDEQKKGSDIDVVVILDDCTINWDQELIAWYREELSKLLAKQSYSARMHVTTVTLSTFMEEVRAGEPAVINMLRYGETLLDHGGFFNPLKVLLAKGRIRPTAESIFVTLRRAPMHLAKAKVDIVASVENVYWSMVDAAHAALMASAQVPPSPEHIGEMLEEVFVKNKLLDRKYTQWYNETYNLAHEILHGNVKYLKGEEIDKHITRAEEFEKVMREMTTNLIENEKIIKVERKEN